jgi:N-6 DNA Methylase
VSSLPTPLRRQLESTIKQARKIAEVGAHHALEALAVHEPDPYQHMDEAHRTLRRQLRAQAKQLGDGESQVKRGAYEIKHLAEKLAYDQWHRLLFARYLLENNLLISPDHGVAVSLADCEELSPSLGLKDAWAVAARFAAKELPEIFRADDPAGAVELSVNDRKLLIEYVTGLPVEVFTASDSLGWCYQFWQAEEKQRVNDTGNKIGADELPAVTQLFTEDYMVDFLLDNTLGAWHAGKIFAAEPKLAENWQSEDELRNAVVLPRCPWKYLRFIKGEEGKWTPAAGTFGGWPKTAQQLRCLDPCMGSGHFVVALFERLVALRCAEEDLEVVDAIAAVIRDNLFGLEIDPRCTQIAAFNLALAAWRRGGYCALPAMNLACSGLAPNAKKEDWLKLAGNSDRLQRGMERLYALFKDAPILGSLINPRALGGDLLEAEFHELQPLMEKALAQESKDDTAHEMAVTARGQAKAAEILGGQFTLVTTNVPFLGMNRQEDKLFDFLKRHYLSAKADLATVFIQRCLECCCEGGTSGIVAPQIWLFLGSYKAFRKNLLKDKTWDLVGRLGPGAFETIGGEVVNVGLFVLSEAIPSETHIVAGLDVSTNGTAQDKAKHLERGSLVTIPQIGQLKNPDARVTLENTADVPLLSKYADSYWGIGSGDIPRFARQFWEFPDINTDWNPLHVTSARTCAYTGREQVIDWRKSRLELCLDESERNLWLANRWNRGSEGWGKNGVAISQMGGLDATLFSGEIYQNGVAAIVPKNPDHLSAVWEFCSSENFFTEVRKIDKKLSVTNLTLIKVPFDLAHWQKVAAEKYPLGLPKPLSNDPTQWLFNGHPKDSDQPLHVAVARLLGYKWPRQTGSNFSGCPALDPDGLEKLEDEDGIVCISATKGEAPAAERLRGLLVKALGTFDLSALLVSTGFKGSKSETLEEWLRDEFFEQHCALFQHRPFIWHIWDGHKSGFSALVNYHKLDHANLEKLTYAYLGDWIRRQQAAVEAGDAGSDARLQAAKQLQIRLKLILEGEPPYDLFVRWKPLSRQAIGWHPDLNDGVRMNIRPFLNQDISGGKKRVGLLRTKLNIKWEKDRGKEPERDKAEYPWFWNWDGEKQDFAGLGKESDGNRWNDCHYSNEFKAAAREAQKKR